MEDRLFEDGGPHTLRVMAYTNVSVGKKRKEAGAGGGSNKEGRGTGGGDLLSFSGLLKVSYDVEIIVDFETEKGGESLSMNCSTTFCIVKFEMGNDNGRVESALW